ncbi:MAG: SRPBCC family protein [Anaerolineae bacterium]
MYVLNRHERILNASAAQVGALMDTLSSPEDKLWPRDLWPRMRFDRPLSVGADGGHGPIRYFVEAYQPGVSIRFQFKAPRGFNGWHGIQIEAIDATTTRLIHTLEMHTSGQAVLSWALVFRPLHDALIEDALDRAQTVFSGQQVTSQWSPYVRFLRGLLSLLGRRSLPKRDGLQPKART